MHVTVVAALTAILAAVIVALAAERLAPSDTAADPLHGRARRPVRPRRRAPTAPDLGRGARSRPRRRRRARSR